MLLDGCGRRLVGPGDIVGQGNIEGLYLRGGNGHKVGHGADFLLRQKVLEAVDYLLPRKGAVLHEYVDGHFPRLRRRGPHRADVGVIGPHPEGVGVLWSRCAVAGWGQEGPLCEAPVILQVRSSGCGGGVRDAFHIGERVHKNVDLSGQKVVALYALGGTEYVNTVTQSDEISG